HLESGTSQRSGPRSTATVVTERRQLGPCYSDPGIHGNSLVFFASQLTDRSDLRCTPRGCWQRREITSGCVNLASCLAGDFAEFDRLAHWLADAEASSTVCRATGGRVCIPTLVNSRWRVATELRGVDAVLAEEVIECRSRYPEKFR